MKKEWVIHLIDCFQISVAKKRYRENNNIAIVKLDALGDGVLWLNAINAVARYHKTLGQKVYLICLSNMAEFYKNFSLCDDIICINSSDFRSIKGRRKIICQLNSFCFRVAYNAVFSRSIRKDDFVMNVLAAKEKIAYVGDHVNCSASMINRPKFYTKWIENPTTYSETQFAHHFVRQLGIPFEGELPQITLKDYRKSDEAYVSIVMGASDLKRAWPIGKFLEVILWILKNTGLSVKILGVKQEQHLFDKIANQVQSDRVHNLIGKTSLVELFQVVNDSVFMISNDTGTAHVAGALNVRCIVLLGGGNGNRFFPHKNERDDCSSLMVLQEPMECFGCGWRCKYSDHGDAAWNCIAHIDEKQVIQQIKSILGV